MLGEDKLAGLVGLPNLGMWNDFAGYDWSSFVFNLVFCATASTIVSGAVAERTKFSSYCIYSLIISLVIYPIEAHWVWGGGWLSQHGFIDFAGSACIHSVGGLCALIGAIMIGARTGKYIRDDAGKVIKVNAIQGHSLTLGALGCFILWFGWYGFNGAAATSLDQLGSIFVTTTIAPAVATFVCLIFTWIKFGKPDVSMCLNASLAGLVAITAGCHAMDATGALVTGVVAGLLVPFGVWFLDNKLHIDDPVGACAVHLLNGIWGTLAVGLFATDTAPENTVNGLFYGGGFKLLGIQVIGLLAVIAWTAVTITITFVIINKTLGLRATEEEEILGLDITEHNLLTSYSDFMPSVKSIQKTLYYSDKVGLDVSGSDMPEIKTAAIVDTGDGVHTPQKTTEGSSTYVAKPVQVRTTTGSDGHKLTKISVICKPEKLQELQYAWSKIGVLGITVTQVMGYGTQKGRVSYYRGVKSDETTLRPKMKVEAVVSKVPVEDMVEAAKSALYTGSIGDGKMFIYDVEDVVKVRTGETGYDALQGEVE
jgi:Amt family ammonium transporter